MASRKQRKALEDQIDQGEGVKAVGKSLARDEATLDAISQITPRDIRNIRRDWKANTIEGAEGLIEATLDALNWNHGST